MMPTFILSREHYTKESTIGHLYQGDTWLCCILEDAKREVKIHGKTCIPAGRYDIILSKSPRFRKITPELLHVPNYSGVRIHPGNTAKDTEGCLLPGLSRGKDFVGHSRKAYNILYKAIEDALKKGRVDILIRDNPLGAPPKLGL